MRRPIHVPPHLELIEVPKPKHVDELVRSAGVDPYIAEIGLLVARALLIGIEAGGGGIGAAAGVIEEWLRERR